jgi:hypothetical protein
VALVTDKIFVRDTAGSWSQFVDVGLASSMGPLSGTGDDDIWFYIRTGGNFRHWNGATYPAFQAPPAPGNGALRALSTTASAGWGVADDGWLAARTKDSWLRLVTHTTRILYGVAPHAEDQAWVVGDGGTILHVDSKGVCPVESGTQQPLYSVWSPQ